MKITYRREMKHNYLIVDPESLTWRNYECRMLAANSIDGVLHFQIRQVDDEIRFYYEITSRQPLDRMLENGSVHTEELRSLVFGISRVLDRMEQYLLPEGSVLLTPDSIYVEPETFRIWLCVVPGLERNFPEDYGKLLEYLLGKVDHQDKDSVVLAYGLYQETRKENYGMEDILRLLGGKKEETPEESEEEDSSEQEPLLPEKSDSRQADIAGRRKDRGAKEKERTQERTKEKTKEDTGMWGRLRGWWRRRRNEKDVDTVQVPWEMMFHEEDMDMEGTKAEAAGFLSFEPSNRIKQTNEEEEAIWPARQPGQSEHLRRSERPRRPPQLEQPGRPSQMERPGRWERPGPPAQPERPEPPVQPGQDTVLLADLTPDARTKLRCLRALEGDGENIVISYYPFIIGKQENLVDYLLPYDTVSRLHLRIDRDGSRYFVQDLNSTNGTTVEGRLLDNNESVEIHEGDEIHIARYRYRFE